ncbi:Transposase [Oopsacas minuta]|uniref:Transposase n=1 Tax=Oopsacas minuta TaxID=111878 RepID=A0AAV7K002_9METZ|nr:Transposase [Oopsacas minuta]
MLTVIATLISIYDLLYLSRIITSRFISNELASDHFLYWGQITFQDEDCLIAIQILEHTEFTEDSTLRSFNASQNYIKRCTQLKFTNPGKMKYINCDQIAIPDEFEKEQCPNKRWAARFRSGDADVTDLPGSGRPLSATNSENIALIESTIMEDKCIAVNQLEQGIEILSGAIHIILTTELGYQSICGKWVPHKLSKNQRLTRLIFSKKLLGTYENCDSRRLTEIITGDETWVYYSTPYSKYKKRSWVNIDGFIFVFDVSLGKTSDQESQKKYAERLLPVLITTKKPIVFVASKCDNLDRDMLNYLIQLSTKRKTYPVVETSVFKGINLEVPLLLIANQVTKKLSPVKNLPYVDALLTYDQTINEMVVSFQKLIDSEVTNFRLKVAQIIPKIKSDAIFVRLSRECGSQKPRGMISQHLRKLREDVEQVKSKEFLEKIMLALKSCLPHVPNDKYTIDQCIQEGDLREKYLAPVNFMDPDVECAKVLIQFQPIFSSRGHSDPHFCIGAGYVTDETNPM